MPPDRGSDAIAQCDSYPRGHNADEAYGLACSAELVRELVIVASRPYSVTFPYGDVVESCMQAGSNSAESHENRRHGLFLGQHARKDIPVAFTPCKGA